MADSEPVSSEGPASKAPRSGELFPALPTQRPIRVGDFIKWKGRVGDVPGTSVEGEVREIEVRDGDHAWLHVALRFYGLKEHLRWVRMGPTVERISKPTYWDSDTPG